MWKKPSRKHHGTVSRPSLANVAEQTVLDVPMGHPAEESACPDGTPTSCSSTIPLTQT